LTDIAETKHQGQGPHGVPTPEHKRHAWWRVMCLTGLDYFSTLGYQPGIAALAAGLLSPLATIVLVALTLLGALPVYRRVAEESPHGEGSIAMLERLLSFWQGKLFVLVLLGFAATDFLITMTLSAADATAHVVENPHVPAAFHGQELLITLVLLGGLGAVFLRGFTEAIGIAVALVGTYLALNPEKEFEVGGEANGRALAYLAHEQLGSTFGTVYDVSTIAILWFAVASAMAGMLNLIPRYLPRYGMAPDWARAIRPLTLVITAVAFLVTWIFDASVDAQGGAYATGVLVLMTSAAVAVTLACRRDGQHRRFVAFALISAVFVYTTIDNVVERPDGVKIGACFIAGIIAVSFWSRVRRSFELRATSVELDATAERFMRDCARRSIRLVANEPDAGDTAEYVQPIRQVVADNDLRDEGDLIFVEVTVTDPRSSRPPSGCTAKWSTVRTGCSGSSHPR
jgi:hypothetical protein